jgi:hypothetical protein
LHKILYPRNVVHSDNSRVPPRTRLMRF